MSTPQTQMQRAQQIHALQQAAMIKSAAEIEMLARHAADLTRQAAHYHNARATLIQAQQAELKALRDAEVLARTPAQGAQGVPSR